jgi:hypothetical protein
MPRTVLNLQAQAPKHDQVHRKFKLKTTHENEN